MALLKSFSEKTLICFSTIARAKKQNQSTAIDSDQPVPCTARDAKERRAALIKVRSPQDLGGCCENQLGCV